MMEKSNLKRYSLQQGWMDEPTVKCKGLTSFFYPNRSNAEVAKAKQVCNGTATDPPCLHRQQCIQYAINHGEMHGVWGGTSERDRRKIRRARAKTGRKDIYTFDDIELTTYSFRIIYVTIRNIKMERHD